MNKPIYFLWRSRKVLRSNAHPLLAIILGEVNKGCAYEKLQKT
jgi:hypothetical protein